MSSVQVRGVGFYDGIYIEVDDGSHFKRAGPPDDQGYQSYLWRSSWSSFWSQGSRWKLGYQENGTTFDPKNATMEVFADGNENPPNTGWEWSDDGRSTTYKMEGLPSLVNTFSETEAAGGSLNVEQGVLCENEYQEWLLITSEKMNDKKVDCKRIPLDELPKMVSTLHWGIKTPLTNIFLLFRPPSQHEEVNRRRRRTNILLASITIVFFVGWSPMVTFTFIHDFANHWLPERKSMVTFAYALSLLSGILTPIGNK